MLAKIKKFFNDQRVKEISDPRNIALYIFALIVLAIAWSGVRTMQNNYQLQQKIVSIKQQNNLLQLQNENAALQNQYYQTNEYLDLAARQDLGLAAPGEKVILIPQSVAFKYVDQSLGDKTAPQPTVNNSKIVRNFEAWRDFLLGRRPLSD